MATRVNKGPEHSEPPKPQPKVPFAKQLQKAPVRDTRVGPKLLERSQKASAAFNAALQSRRTEAEQVRPEHRRIAQTLAQLLVVERKQEHDHHPRLPGAPEAPAPTQTFATGAPSLSNDRTSPPVVALTAKLQSLIARIEQLTLAEGPALQLALEAGGASSIEVVRTAKGEVAVTLTPRSAVDRRALQEKLQEIRAALGERGLSVKRITLAR